MRISDWSSDVCSSDLLGLAVRLQRLTLGVEADRIFQACLASFQPVNDFFKTPQRLFKAQRVYRCRVPIHASACGGSGRLGQAAATPNGQTRRGSTGRTRWPVVNDGKAAPHDADVDWHRCGSRKPALGQFLIPFDYGGTGERKDLR